MDMFCVFTVPSQAFKNADNFTDIFGLGLNPTVMATSKKFLYSVPWLSELNGVQLHVGRTVMDLFRWFTPWC